MLSSKHSTDTVRKAVQSRVMIFIDIIPHKFAIQYKTQSTVQFNLILISYRVRAEYTTRVLEAPTGLPYSWKSFKERQGIASQRTDLTSGKLPGKRSGKRSCCCMQPVHEASFAGAGDSRLWYNLSVQLFRKVCNNKVYLQTKHSPLSTKLWLQRQQVFKSIIYFY